MGLCFEKFELKLFIPHSKNGFEIENILQSWELLTTLAQFTTLINLDDLVNTITLWKRYVDHLNTCLILILFLNTTINRKINTNCLCVLKWQKWLTQCDYFCLNNRSNHLLGTTHIYRRSQELLFYHVII